MGSVPMEHLRHAAWGQTRDTGDDDICFAAVAGEDEQAYDAVKKLVRDEMPNSGLEVLGPFIRQ